MSTTHFEGTDRTDGLNDDGQLRIRIPNPKVFMARQSLWIGRRGKPRCDHCRSSNSKCDRVLPICHRCSLSNPSLECKYTPLPTPAHRGIPRCDRCRAANMKCDRNLPICNNCKEAAQGTACNYTPKKKKKSDAGDSLKPSSLKTEQKILPKTEDENFSVKVEEEEDGGHTFYGHNIAISQDKSPSPTFSGTDLASDLDLSHTGRFTADFARPIEHSPEYTSSEAIPIHQLGTPLEFIAHSLPQDQKNFLSSAHLEPWTHPKFVSLPKFVSQRLRELDVVEMPKRADFDNSLYAFQNGMMEALRETACLFVDKYTKLAHYLNDGGTSTLSDRIRSWASVHRLCSGSEMYNLILAPRDSVFSMDPATAEFHRQQFVADLLSGNTNAESLKVYHYDRVPVREQLYDILTYAHRSHFAAPQMLLEVVRLRYAFITWPMAEMYVKMCPLCNMRSTQGGSYPNSSHPEDDQLVFV